MSEGAGELIGGGVRFERIRRITGYLVGTTDRFNNAKRAEERDRVKHTRSAGTKNTAGGRRWNWNNSTICWLSASARAR